MSTVCRYIIVACSFPTAGDHKLLQRIRHRLQKLPNLWKSAIDDADVYAAYRTDVGASPSAIIIPGSRGAIFGSILGVQPQTKYTMSTLRAMSADCAADILASKGRSLVSQFWGYYVAALYYPEQRNLVVIRSPVSSLACFHLRCGAVNVFFSHVEDIVALEIGALSINWDSITAQLAGGYYLTNETGIEEIHNLECGERVNCGPQGSTRQAYWDPRTYLGNSPIDDFSQAARTLRDTTEFCVSAHSALHRNILVTLSGGLDSSIVFSSLSRAANKPTITAVNYYSRGCGDERKFARSMVTRVRSKIVERPRDNDIDFRRFKDINLTVSPVLNFSAPDVELRNRDLANDLHASAIFDGELGDNIFGRRPDSGVLLEAFRRYRYRAKFFFIAIDYAMLNRQSVWNTLTQMRRESNAVSSSPDFPRETTESTPRGQTENSRSVLTSDGAMDYYSTIADRFVHPWFRNSRFLRPSSYSLLYGLITVTSSSYHSPFAGPNDPLRVSPLVSQPLIELALQIPSYFHSRHAQDRAVARAAFGDVLSPEVLDRGTAKGGPNLWVKDAINKNIKFIREFLLDGILVKRGLLDGRKLEAALSDRMVKSTVMVVDIFAKLYIEAWLKKWSLVTISQGGRY